MAQRTDVEIRELVLTSLDAAASVDLSRVGVRVEEGMVTLVGTVSSPAARHLAAELAGSVAGVTRVIDLLIVADEHAAIEQTQAAEASTRQGSSRGASPQETGLAPSAEDLGPWDDEARTDAR